MSKYAMKRDWWLMLILWGLAGFFIYKIKISEITEAYPTHSSLSAPAWSIDRIRIRYKSSKFGVLISPDMKMEFLKELEELSPHLKMTGKRQRSEV